MIRALYTAATGMTAQETPFVRFASVYREFDDPDEFAETVKRMKDAGSTGILLALGAKSAKTAL